MFTLCTHVCRVDNVGMVCICVRFASVSRACVVDCDILMGAIGLMAVWASAMGALCMDDWN